MTEESDDKGVLVSAADLVALIGHLTNASIRLGTAISRLIERQPDEAAIANRGASDEIDRIIALLSAKLGRDVDDGER